MLQLSEASIWYFILLQVIGAALLLSIIRALHALVYQAEQAKLAASVQRIARRNLSLAQLQALLKQWRNWNFPNSKSAHEPLLGALEELGELAHAHLKGEQGIRGTAGEHAAKGRDAVGDVVLYLADYCSQRGWLLEECVEAAWEEIRDRDWRRYPETGRAPKPEVAAEARG